MSADTMPVARVIFVDRRQNGRDRSAPNRRRLLKRIQQAIRNAKPDTLQLGGVKSMAKQAGSGQASSINVTRKVLHEPSLRYDQEGGRNLVIPGNDRWERGDEFPMPPSGKGRGGGAGHGDDTEDDFVVNVGRDEHLDVIFENCVLPDLRETDDRDLPQTEPLPAGYRTTGSPSQLAIERSFANSFARRLTMNVALQAEIDRVEAAIKVAQATEGFDEVDLAELEVELAELKARHLAIGHFEERDLRYHHTERATIRTVSAVFIMLMDVSGSMDERRKKIARRLFALQYAFIRRVHPGTELVFISHTDTPLECDEDEFFKTMRSGGTTISPAFDFVHKIIRERFDASKTNLYLAYAGDGDNSWDDNENIKQSLVGSGLMGKLRHMSYAQIGDADGEFWEVMNDISGSSGGKRGRRKLDVVALDEEAQVIDKFQQIYRKEGA